MNIRRPHLASLPVVACATTLLLAAAASRADDESPIKTPQPATILLADGKKCDGTLLEVTDKEVRFRAAKQAGADTVYGSAEIKAILTADDAYVYNQDKGTFEAGPPPVGVFPKDRTDPTRDDKQMVIAEGVGIDGEEALKDAFRAAVRQVVGTVVDSETLVANDKVISDKVLVYSDGIIKGGYKELSRSQEKGLVRVKILATVVRRSVAMRLKEANVTTREVGGADIAGEVFTREEARTKAADLLRAALADLPKVLKAEARKPKADDYNDATSSLAIRVTVRPDGAAYNAFNKRLVRILDKVSVSRQPSLFDFTGRDRLLHVPLKGDKQWVFWVFTSRDPHAARGRWSYYVLDCDRAKSFAGAEGEMVVLVSLLDDQGEAVAEDEIPLEYGEAESSLTAPHWLLVRGREGVVVTPFCYAFYFPRRNFAPTLTYRRDVPLSVADLARVKRLKCRVVFRPAKADETGP